MKCQKEDLLLYAITDRAWIGEQTFEEQVKQALLGGVTMLQLREKSMNNQELKEEALKVQALCKEFHVPFIINDNVQLAKEIDADGVHIGQSDEKPQTARAWLGAHKIIGVSAKTAEQAVVAEQNGADYIGCGAVFATHTKKDAVVISYQELKEVCAAVSIPVVAIGGITKENMAQLKGSQISGVALVSAIFAQPDIKEATRQMRHAAKELFAIKPIKN